MGPPFHHKFLEGGRHVFLDIYSRQAPSAWSLESGTIPLPHVYVASCVLVRRFSRGGATAS